MGFWSRRFWPRPRHHQGLPHKLLRAVMKVADFVGNQRMIFSQECCRSPPWPPWKRPMAGRERKPAEYVLHLAECGYLSGCLSIWSRVSIYAKEASLVGVLRAAEVPVQNQMVHSR